MAGVSSINIGQDGLSLLFEARWGNEFESYIWQSFWIWTSKQSFILRHCVVRSWEVVILYIIRDTFDPCGFWCIVCQWPSLLFFTFLKVAQEEEDLWLPYMIITANIVITQSITLKSSPLILLCEFL